MSTSKTGNSSLTGRFHGRTFSIDSSLGRCYSPLLHSLPFWVVSAFLLPSSPFLFVPCSSSAFFSGRSFSHLFLLLLTAFLAALSSRLSRLGRLFYRPASVAHYAVKKPSHRCFCRPLMLVPAGLRPPFFLHILFPDGPLPCRPARV